MTSLSTDAKGSEKSITDELLMIVSFVGDFVTPLDETKMARTKQFAKYFAKSWTDEQLKEFHDSRLGWDASERKIAKTLEPSISENPILIKTMSNRVSQTGCRVIQNVVIKAVIAEQKKILSSLNERGKAIKTFLSIAEPLALEFDKAISGKKDAVASLTSFESELPVELCSTLRESGCLSGFNKSFLDQGNSVVVQFKVNGAHDDITEKICFNIEKGRHASNFKSKHPNKLWLSHPSNSDILVFFSIDETVFKMKVPITDKLDHRYTIIIECDNKYILKTDGVFVESGNLEFDGNYVKKKFSGFLSMGSMSFELFQLKTGKVFKEVIVTDSVLEAEQHASHCNSSISQSSSS